jgi:uncharacterized protein YggE
MKDTYPKYALFTGGLVLLVLLLIKLFNLSYPVEITNTSRTSELSVVGEGKVDVTPDTAYVDVGVTVSNAATVDAAQNQIDGVNNKIIAAMDKLKIPKANIKTSNYSVYPNYDYDNGQNRVSGYNGNVTISVKLSDTKLTSSVITEATKAGANQVQGVRFAIENPDKYREEARNEAIKNAKEQASRLSKELGIRLGGVVNIIESSPSRPVPMYDTASMKAGMGGNAENAVVETGSQTITSVVTLYFEKK